MKHERAQADVTSIMKMVCAQYELALEDHDRIEWLVQRNLVSEQGALETAASIALTREEPSSPVILQPTGATGQSVSLLPAPPSMEPTAQNHQATFGVQSPAQTSTTGFQSPAPKHFSIASPENRQHEPGSRRPQIANWRETWSSETVPPGSSGHHPVVPVPSLMSI